MRRLFSCSLVVLAATLSAYAADTQPAPGSASGSVVTADGKPASGATVTVLAPSKTSDPVTTATATTDADGKFSVTGLNPGGYLFKFAAGNQLGNKSVTIIAGKDTNVGKITVKPPSNTGRKSEPKTGSGGGKAG